jgi:CBS domain-containing protein
MNLTKKQLEVIISSKCSVLEALKKMDSIKRKLLLVVDDEKYNGLLSIGDIQRGIINNIELSSPISSLNRGDYIVANTNSTLPHIKQMMYEIRAAFMPVINNGGNVIDIHFWEDIFTTKETVPLNQFNLPVVIMAGGFGTRLQPITNVIPKPLIPIGEKTMLEEIFDRFGKHGCSDFFISINYKAELIEFYLNKSFLALQIRIF